MRYRIEIICTPIIGDDDDQPAVCYRKALEFHAKPVGTISEADKQGLEFADFVSRNCRYFAAWIYRKCREISLETVQAD